MLNPPFNNDHNDKEMSQAGKDYIQDYKLIRHWSNWRNKIERDARLAEVPIIVVKLKHDFEEVLGELLAEIPKLADSNIFLPTFYAKLKKLHQNLDVDFDEFVFALSASLEDMSYSTEQLSYLVLVDKSLPQSLLKKNKR